MKNILESSFRYKPSFDTDVRKTFARIRRQRQQEQPQAPREEASDRIRYLEPLDRQRSSRLAK